MLIQNSNEQYNRFTVKNNMAIELETEDNKLQPINLRSWTTNNHSTETELSYCPCNMPKTTNVNVSYIEEKLSAFRSSEIGLTPHI